jgi:hypothetical protein
MTLKFNKLSFEDATRRDAYRARQKLSHLHTDDIERVADVIVGVGKGAFTKQTALNWLQNSPEGQSLMASLSKKETPMLTREQELQEIAKNGVVSVAKLMLEDPKYAKAVTEVEFVEMLKHEARAYQKPSENVDQAFSRMFQAQTPEGLLLRQAHAGVRNANFPQVVTEQSPQLVSKGGTFDKLLTGDSKSAYDQLVDKAEFLRKFEPELTFDQAFARVYTAPANIELAKRERSENRPDPGTGTNYPYPGGKH